MTATVGIVGGGIAGAAAAYGLADAPVEVVLFEAGDRLGGRMVTHERDGCLYDSGANFVKGGDELTRKVLTDAVGDALETVGGDVWLFDADGTVREGRQNQAPKYTTREGVSEITAALARESGATIETDTRVGHADRQGDGWGLSTTGGRERRFDGLVLALPAGETASLLADADWGHPLKDDLMVAAEGVPHRPVATVVAHYPFRVDVPYYGLVSADNRHDVGFIAREECKPGHVPDGESLLIVQLSPRWTANNFDADETTACSVACDSAAALFDDDRLEDPDWTKHTRWIGAVPDHGIDGELIERAPRHDLAVAGDWTVGIGRTYAALKSGLDAAEQISDRVV